MKPSTNIKHICYENSVPEEIELHLANLYQSSFCVKEYFQLYKTFPNYCALVIYADIEKPIHAIFYTVVGKEITVLNELFDIEQEYIRYFTEFAFAKYPEVHSIHLNRVRSSFDGFYHHYRIWSTPNDIVVQLPESFEKYRASLGKHTKSNLSNYSNKLRKEFSDFAFTVTAANDVDPAAVRRIVELNRLRMENKDIVSVVDNSLENKMVKFAEKYGLVATISVNGQIVAGTVCFAVGNHCYGDIISHNPEYNKYSIGQVCIYLTIKSLIERGFKVFHLMWGDFEYKYRFLGVKQDFCFASVYRERQYKFLSAFKYFTKFKYVIFIRDVIKYECVGRIRRMFSKMVRGF